MTVQARLRAARRMWRGRRLFRGTRGAIGIVDALLSALLLALLLRTLAPYALEYASELKAQQASAQLRQFHAAGEKWLKANYGGIAAALAGGPQQITYAQLTAGPYLSAAVVNTNSYRQTHFVAARNTASGLVELVTLTQAGTAMPTRFMATAAQSYVAGGYVTPGAVNTLSGGSANYTIDTTAYNAIGYAAAAGHVGAASWFSPLELLGSGTTLQSETIVGHGDLVTKPVCTGTQVPRIFLSVAKAALGAAGGLWDSVQTQALDIGAQWQIVFQMRSETTAVVNPTSAYGAAVAQVICSAT